MGREDRIDSETQAYVDRGNQANYFWEIVPQGNKNFRIKGADENPDYNSFNGEMWFGMSSEPDPATAISPRIDLAADPNASVDWQFIPEAAYDEYQEKVAPYLAAMHLKEMIEWAMEQGVKGYFEFIQLPRYSNLKGVTSARQYLTNIKNDGYATGYLYVDHTMALVDLYDLTQFDK